jgi:hypothetical protein
MATDPTRDEADGASKDGRDESTAAARTPGPPRPPRPGKRSKESGRISIPLPQSRRELDLVDANVPADDSMDAAPGVDIATAERDEPAFPLIAVRAKPPSAPAESFADLDADVADQAPNAPVTPLHGLSAREIDAVEITPPHGTPRQAVRQEPLGASNRFGHQASFRGGPMRFGRDDESDSEPEPTIVGKVPDNLLELSGAKEENTQAFTAPRELIELAKRSREERARASVPSSAEQHETPRARRAANDDAPDVSLPAAPRVPLECLPSADYEPESEAAPPVKRTLSGEMEAAALPSRRAFDSGPAMSSGPDIDIDLPSDRPRSIPAAAPPESRSVTGVSSELPSALRRPASRRGWLMTVGLFVIAGILIARWRELASLFH